MMTAPPPNKPLAPSPPPERGRSASVASRVGVNGAERWRAPLSKFPIAWEEGSSDQPIPTEQCPYANAEIEEYLKGNHYHWVLNEPPLGFRVGGPMLFRREVVRHYWLFGATDDLERQWFVVVGSGQNPFDPTKKMRRWMYGETNDLNQTPDAFMDDAYAEQLVHDARRDG